MKTKLFTLGMFVLSVLIVSGCGSRAQGVHGSQPPAHVTVIENSGVLVSQEYDLAVFEQIQVENTFDVEIKQGDTFRVVTRVEENAAPYVRVTVEGNRLKIGLDPKKTYHMINVSLRAEITLPKLTGLSLGGASQATLESFQLAEEADVALEGASSLYGEVEADKINLEASMAAAVTLSGSAQDVVLKTWGGSRVDLGGLGVANADVEASGGSTAIVNPSGRLDARADGGAHVYYLGGPTLGRISTSGGALIAQR